MSKLLRFLACLFMLIFVGNALAAGYSCPTYKKYTSCNAGYYISDCGTSSSGWTGQTISEDSLTVANSCVACPDGYTCDGELTCPEQEGVTITYNKNGAGQYCYGNFGTTFTQNCTTSTCTLPPWNSGSCALSLTNEPEKIFVGWSTDPNATTGLTGSIPAPTGPVTYYAIFVLPEVTVENGDYSLSASQLNRPRVSVNCNNGYSQNGETDETTSFTVVGTAGVAEISAACLPRSYSCSAGQYLNGTSCTSCASPYYCLGGTWTYNGGIQGRSSCSSLSGASPSGGTYSSVSPYDAATTCRYKAPTKTITGCQTVTSNTVSYSGSAWPASTYSVTAKGGYVISGNNTANATCSICGAGKYSAGGTATSCGTCANWTYSSAGAASCTSCPTLTSGWSKKDSTSTGWTSYTSCVQVSGIPSNCSAGSLKQTATSSTTWGASTVNSALSANAKYYVNGTSCSACPAGSYCTGGTAAATKCAVGSYSTGTASACTVCGAGKTTASTGTTAASSCTSCTSISGLSTWATPTWSANTVSNLCTVSTCQANYYKNGNACPTCSSGTNGDYTKSAAGTTSVNSCYLTTTAGNYVATAQAGEVTCAAGGWCPGGSNIYYGTGTTTGGRTACSTLGSGYTNTSIGQSSNTSCYLPVAAGKVRTGTSGTTLETCDAGTYKAAHNAYYGTSYSCDNCTGRTKYSAAGAGSCSTVSSGYYTTGCDSSSNNCTGQSQCTGATYCSSGVQYNCPTNYDDETTTAGKTSANQCKINCSGGYRVTSANAACSAITSGNVYIGSHSVAYGSTSPAATSCPTSYTISGTTASDHDQKSDCKISCAAGTRVTSADAVCSTPTGSWYTSAHTVSAGSTSASYLKSCLTNYSTPNTTTRTDHDASSDCTISCSAGTRITSANATSCTTPSGNWYVGAHTVSQGSISSVNSCLTNYSISGTAAANHDAANDCKISCSGGSYIAAANNTSCSAVGSGYWAAASTISQGSAGVRNACDSGLTTIGSGAGADEAADCGRVLNVNGEKIYLRSEKKTTPSLNVSISGKTFYGNMGTSTVGSLKIKSGSTTYSVYDDSML